MPRKSYLLQKARKEKDLAIIAVPQRELDLTPMQNKFCEILVLREDLPQYQAAIEAGYSETGAAKMASKMLSLPAVQNRIYELKAEIAKKYEVTFDNHVRKLAEIRDLALEAQAFGPAITAEKSRGQVGGLYIERKEILHGRIDQMSKEEVMNEIKNLLTEFPSLKALVDTEPKQPMKEITDARIQDGVVDVEVIKGSDEDEGVLDKD